MWKLTFTLPFVSRKRYQEAMRSWIQAAETVGELMDEVARLQEINDADAEIIAGARAELAATRRDLRECQEANADLRADIDALRQEMESRPAREWKFVSDTWESLCGCSSELHADAAREVVP